MMQLANSTFYMSGAQARLSSQSSSSNTSADGVLSADGPSTAAVIRLRKSDNPRRTSSRASVGSTRSSSRHAAAAAAPTAAVATGSAEEEVSPDEMAQSSSSAPISPTLSPSSRVMLKRKQLNASLALRSHPFSTSPSACSTSSSAASSLVSFGSTSSKSSSLKRSSPEEGNLASRLRNLQISELIDAILLVEGKLKKEQKMIARELRGRDLQISQQLKEIERYREERKQNLCGFCQKKMDNVSASCGGVERQQQQQKARQLLGDRVTEMKSIQVQTEEEEVTGFKAVARNRRATVQEEATPVTADDDWYANANSDNENEKNPVNLYERGVNPVLERVNQILLQESMDTSTDDAAAVAASRATAAEVSARAAAPLPHSVQQLMREQQLKLAERMQSTRIPEIRKASTTTTTTSTAPIGKCAPIVMKRPPHKLSLSSSSAVHPPILMRAHSSPVSSVNGGGGRENEYEVIGSEQDSSNYYMEMQSPIDAKTFLLAAATGSGGDEVEYKNVLTRKEGLELLKLIAPHAGQPPALPPKPANLMKFKKVAPPPTSAKIVTAVTSNVTQIAKSQLVKSAPEPDYCSISECGANNSVRSSSSGRRSNKAPAAAPPSIVGGGVDRVDDCETTSSKTSEDTLEHIIKLPNVAAIIVPKNNTNGHVGGPLANHSHNSNNMVITKDNNYNTKTVMNVKPLSSPAGGAGGAGVGMRSPKAKDTPNGMLKDLPPMSGGGESKRYPSSPHRNSVNLPSIVERRQNLMHRLSVQNHHSHHGLMMKRYSMDALSPQIQPEEVKGTSNVGSNGLFEERIPIQAEFDWYNLDAEFGKFNAQDVIKEAKSSGSESGSVSGGDDERMQRPSSKMALDRGLGELRDLERKMSTLERKRLGEQRTDGASKEMVHFC